MTLIITADQQAILTAVFKDASGGAYTPNLADPHAPQPLWSEDSKGTVIVISPSDDQLTCLVVGIAPGTAQVMCKDRGTDKQATETVVVREGGVQQIAISAGTPERQTSKAADKSVGEFSPHLGGVVFDEPIKSKPAEPVIPPPPEDLPPIT